MKRTAKWQRTLTLKQLRHMKKMQKTLTLRDFKQLRAGQKRLEKKNGSMTGSACWECHEIERRLILAGAMEKEPSQ